MSVTDGPTLQDVERLNAINRGDVQDPMSGQWGPANGGAGSGPGIDYSALFKQQQPDYGAMRGQLAQQMAARQPQAAAGGANPWAAYMAQMGQRAQPAAAGGGGKNPYEEIAAIMAERDLNPYDQYFADRGPMSGSEGGMGWMNALQPWQGGSSGTLPGTGINTSGFTFGGGMTRADPAYWGYTGPGTRWSPGNVINRWVDLRQSDPTSFMNFGGQGGMDAGIAGGFGPGEGSGGGGGGGFGGGGGGGGGGSGQGPSNSGGSSPSQGTSTSNSFGAGATGFNGFGAGGTGLAGGFSNGGYDMGYGTVGFGNGFGSTGTGSVGSPTGPGTVGGFGTGDFGGGIGIGGLGAIGGSTGDNGQGYGSPF